MIGRSAIIVYRKPMPSRGHLDQQPLDCRIAHLLRCL
jgi:hypothetical protein